MPEKVLYLYLFILCVNWSQGIVGTFLEDDIEETSFTKKLAEESANVLVREKRVINRTPGEDVPLTPEAAPYVVKIKQNNRLYCVGAILSHHTVITAARCVRNTPDLSMYTVVSGSPYTYSGLIHNIIEKKLYGHNTPKGSTLISGIALLIVNPTFVYRSNTASINLHTEPILPGINATVSGWGSCVYGGKIETAHPRILRSINVPIMYHSSCVNSYRGSFQIGEENICTSHPQKLCAHTDLGAPLVIDKELAGIHLGDIEIKRMIVSNKPDVFVLLQHLEYGQWIRRNIVE